MKRQSNEVTAVLSREDEGKLLFPFGSDDFLETLWNEAMKIQSECIDVTLNKANKALHVKSDMGAITHKVYETLWFKPDSVETYGKLLNSHYCDEYHWGNLNEYSFGQLCNKIGVPYRYMQKCKKAGEIGLMLDNMNKWISFYDKKVLLRLYQNEVRGILGSRYSALDAPDIIQAISQTDLGNTRVKGYYIDPTRLHMRLVYEEPIHVLGEDLFPGIVVDSSDVGKSSLKVNFFVWKQVCTNGLMLAVEGTEIFVQRHMGLTYDEFLGGLKEGLSKVPEIATEVQCRIEDVVKGESLTRKKLISLLKKVKNPQLFSEKAVEEITDLACSDWSPTQWGLVNAVTQYAQRFSLERRIQLEEAAGDILYQLVI